MKKTLTALAAAVLAVSAASAYSFTYAPTQSFKAEVSVSPKAVSSFSVSNTHDTFYAAKYPEVTRKLERQFKNKFEFKPQLSFFTDINDDLSIKTTFDFATSASANWKYTNTAAHGEKYDADKFGKYSYSSLADFGYKDGSYKINVKSKMYGTLEFSPSEGSIVDKSASLAAKYSGVNLDDAERGFQYTSNDFDVQGGKVNFGLSYTKGDAGRIYGATASYSFDDNQYTTDNTLVVNYEKTYSFTKVAATEENPKETLRTKRGNYYDLAYSFKAYGASAKLWVGRGFAFTPERLDQAQKYSKVVVNEIGTKLSYSYGDFGTVTYTYAAAFGHSPSYTTTDYLRTIYFQNKLGYKTAKFPVAQNVAVQFATNLNFNKMKVARYLKDTTNYGKKLERSFHLSATLTF